jgi:hypothetical protein
MKSRMKRSVAFCFKHRSSVDNKKRSCAITVLRPRRCALQIFSAHDKRSTAGRYNNG